MSETVTKARIFISHATKDDNAVNAIAEQLEAGGIDTWVDHRQGLEPGTPNWDKALRAAIQDCEFGLLVMSPRSLASDICSAECLLLRDLGKPLYVLLLETCSPDTIWLYIRLIQYADGRADLSAGVAALLRVLRGQSAEEASAPTALGGRITGIDTMRVYLPYLDKIPLYGREAEMNELRVKLADGQATQIIGVGGKGKSRLAAELALSAKQGAVWHRCNSSSAAYEWLELLRKHAGLDKDAPQEAILQVLQTQAPLVVLDNAEDVPADDSRRPAYRQLAQALVSRRVPLLITSRRAWTDVQPRYAHDLNSLPPAIAEKLAHDFAHAANLSLNAAQCAALAQAARYHPRLIEFAVEQVQDGRRYERVLKLLNEGEHEDVQERMDEMVHKSIRDMVAHDKHGADAEALLKCLCVGRGSLDMAAILALRPEDWDEDRAEDALETLYQWRFVHRDADERTRVEELVLQALPPDPAAAPRHFDHFFALHSDYDANQAYAEDGSMLRHAVLEADWDNIRAALDWGLKEQPEPACDWAWAVQYFMMLRRSSAERLSLLEAALKAAQGAGYQRGEANTLQALGDLSVRRAELEAARAYYDRALPLYETIGARLGLANTLVALGDLSVRRAELEAARAYYDRALPLYETIGARLGLANTLQALGDLSVRRAELEAARAYYDRALPLYETIGDRLGLANTLKALGDLSVLRDELEAARAYYDRALPLYETIGARLGLANTLVALGDLSVRRDELEAARAYYDRALPLYETIGARLGLANTLVALGDLSVRRDELEAARAYYDRALPLYETIGDRLGLANTLVALGDLSVRRDELEAARAYYDRALPLYETIGDRLGLANTLVALGDLSVRRDELEAARAYYDRALPLYETIGARLGLANTLVALGDLSVRRDELEAARAYYDRALPLYETIGARLGLANTLVALGDLSVRRDELEAARAYYDRALPLYETIGARLGLAYTLKVLGDLSVRRDELEAARAYYDRALPLYETIGDRLGLANTLVALGELSVRRDELEAARAYYDRALPLYETIGARLGLAYTLKVLGDLSVRRDELEAARAYYDRALPLYETIGARLGLAHTLLALGDLSVRRAELEAARAYYDRALPLYETIGDRRGLANTLKALGDLSVRRAELEAARAYYDRALPLYETIGARLGLAHTLVALGDLSVRRAELEAARAYYDRALPLYETIGARLGLANTLKSFGALEQAKDNWQSALGYFNQARKIYQSISDEYSDASIFYWGYKTYAHLGLVKEGVDGLLAALRIYKKVGQDHFAQDIVGFIREYRMIVGETVFDKLWESLPNSFRLVE